MAESDLQAHRRERLYEFVMGGLAHAVLPALLLEDQTNAALRLAGVALNWAIWIAFRVDVTIRFRRGRAGVAGVEDGARRQGSERSTLTLFFEEFRRREAFHVRVLRHLGLCTRRRPNLGSLTADSGR